MVCYNKVMYNINPFEAENLYYVGTILNPKNKQPYAIWHTWESGDPEVLVTYLTKKPIIEDDDILGRGYYDDPVNVPSLGAMCPRIHTPAGIKFAGQGLGFVLYAGLLLAEAVFIKHWEELKETYWEEDENGYRDSVGFDPTTDGETLMGSCVHSISTNRSPSAEDWWDSQIERGFAAADTHCYDETIDYEGSGQPQRTDELIKAIREETKSNILDLQEELEETDDPKARILIEKQIRFAKSELGSEVKVIPQVKYQVCAANKLTYIPIKKLLESGLVLDAVFFEKEVIKNLPPIFKLLKIDLSNADPEFVDEVIVRALKEKGATKEHLEKIRKKPRRRRAF
jgi:hypothetical protein